MPWSVGAIRKTLGRVAGSTSAVPPAKTTPIGTPRRAAIRHEASMPVPSSTIATACRRRLRGGHSRRARGGEPVVHRCDRQRVVVSPTRMPVALTSSGREPRPVLDRLTEVGRARERRVDDDQQRASSRSCRRSRRARATERQSERAATDAAARDTRHGHARRGDARRVSRRDHDGRIEDDDGRRADDDRGCARRRGARGPRARRIAQQVGDPASRPRADAPAVGSSTSSTGAPVATPRRASAALARRRQLARRHVARRARSGRASCSASATNAASSARACGVAKSERKKPPAAPAGAMATSRCSSGVSDGKTGGRLQRAGDARRASIVPGVGRDVAGEQPQHGRLAGAVRADERRHGAGLERRARRRLPRRARRSACEAARPRGRAAAGGSACSAARLACAAAPAGRSRPSRARRRRAA